MKFLCLVLLYVVTISYSNLFGQQDEKPFVFPHKAGDMFQYFCEDGPGWYDTIQVFTVFDTTFDNGIIHMKQKAFMLNPFRPADFFMNTETNYWIDTINQSVFGTGIDTDSTLLFKLNGKVGDLWVDTLNFEVVKVVDKWTQTVWNKEMSVMEIAHYRPGDLNDTTTWLDIFGMYVADGFGIVYKGAGWSYSIMGAVINGVLYGDTTLVTSVNNSSSIPETIKLNQNYPNPFNPSTEIDYMVKQPGYVSLKVYDIIGNEVACLVDEVQSEGSHSVTFNAGNLASGVYIYSLVVNDFIAVRKMSLIK